ncbi:hypothetical protein PsorP6_004996 [Peronosclerospora sorghi]|uniref:Uncharacterized protein n=1 Tax=Peronosclerospora sorghi TaxID=230839 RepID=A0ACC0W5Z9_9STRA|nr:hypothetical protein PsorP6_004996 [Peronosclerospora sorghi]
MPGDLWHRRFGHASPDAVKKVCDVCKLSKQSRKPYPVRDDCGSIISNIVFSDVLGSITPASRSGFAFAVTFIKMETRLVNV